MKYADKTRELLFLTYLTNYNIKEIYSIEREGWIDDIKNYLCDQAINNKRPIPSSLELGRIVDKAHVEADYAFEHVLYHKITPIPYFAREYPSSLKALKDCPPLLFTKGKLKRMSLAAVVGTRDISHHADRITSKIVGTLVDKGYGIVSGLALGIDTIAHERAIQNSGYTLAVLPNSLDSIYPKENLRLANQILDEGGALVSELCVNINRGKKSFVERNRIQTAFSEVVIPIEMSAKSGTMHTINFSKQQKKTIYILKPSGPQLILSQYEGILELINQQQNSPRPNIHIVESMPDFIQKLNSPRHPFGKQISIFNEDDDAKNRELRFIEQFSAMSVMDIAPEDRSVVLEGGILVKIGDSVNLSDTITGIVESIGVSNPEGLRPVSIRPKGGGQPYLILAPRLR